MFEIIEKDLISSISIDGNSNNNNTILELHDGDKMFGFISNINDVSLQTTEFDEEYTSILKSADIKTLILKTRNNNDNNHNKIENEVNMIDIIYIKIPDDQTLGVGVTFDSMNDYCTGLKIITIEEKGYLSMKLGNKLKIGDKITTLNDISLEKLSPNVACALLNDINTKNRSITLHHYHENKEKMNIHEIFYNIRKGYIQNRIKKDYKDMKTLSNKYNLHPLMKKSHKIEQQNLLKTYHRFKESFE